MKKEWYCCPMCGFRLLIIDKSKHIEGVYIKCKKHGGEVEIKNEPEPEPIAS